MDVSPEKPPDRPLAWTNDNKDVALPKLVERLLQYQKYDESYSIVDDAWLSEKTIPELRDLIETYLTVARSDPVLKKRVVDKHEDERVRIETKYLSLRIRNCTVQSCQCMGLDIACALVALKCHVGGWVCFDGAAFGNGPLFRRVEFGDRASFRHADFGDRALFDEAVFGNEASFNDAAFGNEASFYRTAFGNGVTFIGATIGDRASFCGTAFGVAATFDGAAFGDGTTFIQATFGEWTSFRSAVFGVNAGFQSAVFGQGALFDGAVFGACASFDQTSFGGWSSFYGSAFDDQTSFRGAEFHGRGTFGGSLPAGHDDNFAGNVFFTGAEIGHHLDLSSVTFGEDSRLGFNRAILRAGAEIVLPRDLVLSGRSIIVGEDSKDAEALSRAAVDYNILRDLYRGQPGTDDEEDICHLRYMRLKRKSVAMKEEQTLRQRAYVLFDRWVFDFCLAYLVKPWRIAIVGAVVVLALAILYTVHIGNGSIAFSPIDGASDPMGIGMRFLRAIYFSMITFVTIGYGDITPIGWYKGVAAVEGFLGVSLIALFTVAWGRKMIR